MATQNSEKQRIAQDLLAHGEKFKIGDITIIRSPTNSSDTPAVIISVPKKNCKGAVKRNRIRRQLKALVSKNSDKKTPTNWMLICKTNLLTPELLSQLKAFVSSNNAEKTE